MPGCPLLTKPLVGREGEKWPPFDYASPLDMGFGKNTEKGFVFFALKCTQLIEFEAHSSCNIIRK